MTRKGYKHTELGEIPEDWEVKTLGEIAEFSKGHGYSKNDLTPNGTPIILYGSMYTSYKASIINVSTFCNQKEKSIISKEREVIVPASGETAEDIAIASNIEQIGVVIGGDLNIIYPKDNLLPSFLANIISHGPSHIDLVIRAQGKTVVHLHNDDLKNIYIPLPPLPEQRAIASVLSDMDAEIEALEAKRNKYTKIKQGMMQDLLTGRVRLNF